MKLKTYPPTPKLGDTKTIIKFAWWPTRVENSLIWLERYEEVWTFSVCYSSLGGKLSNPIPYDDCKFTCKKLYNVIDCLEKPTPLTDRKLYNVTDPDSRSLQTQIYLKKVIPGNPRMIREDFTTTPPKHLQNFIKDCIKQDPQIKEFAQRFRYFQK